MTTVMSSSNTLIVGSISLDTIETVSDRKESLLGGSATYAAVSCSKFVKPNLVGIVGSDFSDPHKQILVDSCESLEDLISKKGSTFRWGGKYFDNGDERETLFTELGVFDQFEPVVSKINEKPDYVFLANIGPDLQLRVLDQLKGKPMVILDTMNLWIDIDLEGVKEVISKSNIFLLNDEEAMQLTGITDMIEAGKAIQNMGPETVIIKLGGKGSLLIEKNLCFLMG